MSTFTTNKSIEKPGNGEYVNTWNVPVNADWDIVDAALGGVATVALTNVNVTLTTAQSQNLRLKFTGTLTGNVIISLPAVGGIWIVDNQTTGAFTVTIKTVAGGSTGVAVNQAVRSIIVADATNVYFADDRLTGTITGVTAGTGMSGGGTSGTVTVNLANTAVTPGTYGSATQVAVPVVDAQGRITGITNTAIGTATGAAVVGAASSDAGRLALSALGIPSLVMTHRLPSGTNSGSSVSGSTWTQRPLNTTVLNNIGGTPLASNQVTLPAGKYYFDYFGEISGTNGKNRLYNVTDSSEVALGMNSIGRVLGAGGQGQVVGDFTIASSKVFEFQIRCFDSGDRCGQASAVGVDEIYCIAKFWKLT